MRNETASLIGETLGQYRLTKELGKGGFATVYRALQPTLNRDVAVKVLHPEFIRDERALRRFKREALAVARLAHPNIVAVYDYGEHEGRAYLVMEYIAGRNLKNRLGRAAPLSLTLDVVTAVGSALDYAHGKGLVHRDVKPANILFTEDGRIVLSDFGIVRLADDDSSLTRGVIGTPQYMSPEQALGRDVDGRSDLYSLGVVMFEMLTGRVPFKGDTPVATLSMHATVPPPGARERNPDLTVGIEIVAARALSKNPDERYQSGLELRSALAAAIADAQNPVDSTVLVGSTTITPPSLPVPEAPDPEAMYRNLLDLTRKRDWRAAVNAAAQILAIDSNYRDVSAILASASNELRFGRSTSSVEIELSNLVSQAESAVNGGRLMEAATILQQILRSSPEDAAIRTRLEEVNQRLAGEEARRRRSSRLEQLYGLAQSKLTNSDWHWANHILEEIQAIDPTYRDVPALLERASTQLRLHRQDETSARHVAEMRDDAEAAMAAEEWDVALRLWDEIAGLEPGLAGVQERRDIARHQSTLAALNNQAARLVADGRWQEAIAKLEEIKALTAR